MNYMKIYCLEALGYITTNKLKYQIKKCIICNNFGHTSYECHKFYQY